MYIMLCTLSELFYIMEYYLIYIYKEVKAIYYECHEKTQIIWEQLGNVEFNMTHMQLACFLH